MIHRLQIQGMAIIDELSIDFSSGFNVITGETGAGKSILIRALSFLLGQKVGPDMIRQGFDVATVSGEFFLEPHHDVFQSMKQFGIPFDLEESPISIVIRREVNSKGRASAWINDCSVTQATLKEVGLSLVDIFGQHENQKLMKPEYHLSYLDKFLSDTESLKKYKAGYRQCAGKMRELEDLLADFQSGRRDLDYRLFRLKELQEFHPTLSDYMEAKERTDSSRSAVEMKEGLATILEVLGNSEAAVNRNLWDAVKKIGRLADKLQDPQLQELKDKAETLASEVDNLDFELSRLAQNADVDEESLEKAHRRLFGYQELFRKHSVTDIESLLREYEKLQRDCLSQEELGENLERELKALAQSAESLGNHAREISRLRLKAASRVKEMVEKELSDLAMPGAVFDVLWDSVEPKKWSLNCSAFEREALNALSDKVVSLLEPLGGEGMERAEFMLAANPGEPVLPLLRVASGGELSRIMLALKKAIVADADTCVLVFDEIDTGISGRVADVVGKKMKSLSKAFQVICISHLPQVAAYADTHFLVHKKSKSERTQSRISKLSPQESTAEIARLLSGSEVSQAGLLNAKALQDKARKQSATSQLGKTGN